MTVFEAYFVPAKISCVASNSVANLEDVPEMAQTNSFQYELDPAGAQAYPSMHFIGCKGLHNTF